MYTFVIGFIIVLAFLVLTFGGFEYVLSATMGGKQGGKDKIIAAILGLLIALASYLILYTINPDLVQFNIFRNLGRSRSWRPTDVSIPVTDYVLTGVCGEMVVSNSYPSKESAKMRLQVHKWHASAARSVVFRWRGNGAGGPPTWASAPLGQMALPDTLGFTQTRADSDLLTTGSQDHVHLWRPDQHCLNTYGAKHTHCPTTMAALFTVESSGNPTASNGGLGQVLPANALSGCNLSQVDCQINSSVTQLNKDCTLYPNLSNCIAAYNGGTGSTPGTSPNGGHASLAASVDCAAQGLYAYQCLTPRRSQDNAAGGRKYMPPP